jgi:predicted ATP-dependent Lon-type protease
MTRRPQQRRQSRNGGGSLSPGTHVSLTLTQFILIMGAVVTVAGGYYWMQSNVVSTVAKVDTFSAKLDQAVKTSADQFKDQDNKRDQLGKDFLASQAQIVAKVSDLNAAVTVQQHDTKTIADTLAKISDQLNTVAIVPSAKCTGSRC